METLYDELAAELLVLNTHLLQIPAKQHLSRLTQGERSVLFYLLTHHSTAHPRELSKTMLVSTARIAALLGRMEEKQLIARSPDPRDNRQVIVTLLPEGQQVIQQIHLRAIESVSRMLEALGPEDAREYLRLQRKILANASREN
ncbi:MAG: MarR family transcriptional regulator [Ruminiclostridium sp.]|nr:MarR family transcriptional regulator [Ruminiclostridium sp.]MBQ9851572.1 MarR family transcriptional regulator [Ruminiclostridium sp.]MBQ9933987.1 MarR family transcriptional regulator [Ruminiclostridium sp.]